MVLKRLFTTALGALGLGALAAGSAFAQETPGAGNIPAPDIFDDQITCSTNVPSMTPTPTRLPPNAASGAMTTLDTLIGMGDSVIITDPNDGDFNAGYNDLGYVIPPMGANCGAGPDAASFVTGIDADDDGMFDGENDVAPKGPIPADVAAGYSEVLEKFVAAYGDPGDNADGGTAGVLADAQKALNKAIEDGMSGAALTPLQNAVTTAETAHNKAKAAFNDIAGGPIYQAGVAEWMAKAAVTKSVADYNTQVGKANMAKMTLDDMDYGSYVPLGNNELFDSGNATTVVSIDADGMATVNLNQLIQYTNGDLNNPQVGMHGVAGMGDGQGDNAPMGSNTDASNFDAAGNLIVPMEPNTANDAGDNANLLDLRSVIDGTNNGVDMIRTTVENANIAAAALKKARDENLNPSTQTTYDEAYRRAQAEADYYNEQWAKVLADDTDIRTDAQKLNFIDDGAGQGGVAGDGIRNGDEADNPNYEANPITIARRHGEYTSESNKRFTAEQNLRAAVAAREAATAAVRTAFTSPHSFYEQLVSRRQALKVAADRVVAGASEDGGTPTDAQTKAATDAAAALTKAEEAQQSFASLFEDADNPTVGLINELLKTGGDDGQALVDAISATYDTAAGAADAAREVVEELTSEGGAVAMNTQRSMDNADSIVELDGRVTQNEDDIAANTTMIGENRTMIGENRDMIATNAGNIATNTTMIGENRGMLETNAGDIMTNAGHIMENRGMIEMNASGVSSNADAIAANMNSIGSNSSAISDNRNMIGELSDDLDVVRAGVAASMALAGMPAINGRGISIGVGSFDGESAFAVGFQIQGEMASFKVGVTSASGATGASAGVGFQF